MRTKKVETAAIVTIHDGGKMTKRGRKAIAMWLRTHATWLELHGMDYGKQFRGHYCYTRGASTAKAHIQRVLRAARSSTQHV